MRVYDKEVLTIDRHPDGYHVATWTGFGRGDGYRRPMDACIPFIEKQASGTWVADLTGWSPTTKADQAWTIEDWFPRAVAAGLRDLVVILPKSALAGMSVKSVMSQAGDIEVGQHYVGSLEEAHAIASERRKAA